MLPFTIEELRTAAAATRVRRLQTTPESRRADRVLRVLQQSPRFAVEADAPHYGSGTASYRDLFCHRRPSQRAIEASATQSRQLEVDGICLYVSEVLPAATWSQQTRTYSYRLDDQHRPRLSSFGHAFLSPDDLLCMPTSGNWTDISKAVWHALASEGFHVLGSDLLAEPLPDGLQVGSWLSALSGRPRPTMFDALFAWAD